MSRPTDEIDVPPQPVAAEMRERGTWVVFGGFRIDLTAQCLLRSEQALTLRPKTWEVLCYLVENAGRLITKDELITEVWAGTAVTDGTLTQSIRELRAVLDDDPKRPRFIATVHRRGYRFIAQLELERTASDRPKPRPLPTLPLVGRDVELAQLNAAAGEAREGRRRCVFATGDPGIGKTALIDRFIEGLVALRSAPKIRPGSPQDRHSVGEGAGAFLVGRGQCLEQRREAEPYLPMLEALHRLCSGDRGADVIAIVKRFAPTWLVQMPWLLASADLEVLQRQLMGTGPERMLREFTLAMDELAKLTPLVLVLEDLHWSDLATVDLLAALARQRTPARILIVASLRPVVAGAQRHPFEDLLVTLLSRGDAAEIALGALSIEAARAYVIAELGDSAPVELIDALYRHSGGNPLFLVTALGYVLEQRWIENRDNAWRLTLPLEQLDAAIPAGLRQLIEIQAAALEQEERVLLEAASVAGMNINARILATVTNRTVAEIDAVLMRVSRRYPFVRHVAGNESGAFEFAHALYRHVLYESTMPQTRRHLHLDVARAVELDLGDRVAEIPAELALHFERGGAYEDAARYLGLAALNAHARVADRESAALLENALRLIARVEDSPRRQRREADLWIQLGAVRGSIYGRGAEQYFPPFQRAWEISKKLDDVPRMFMSRIAGVGYFGLTEQLRQAEEVCRDLLALAARVPLPDMVAVAHAATGSVLLAMGRLEEARRHLETALATLNPYDPSTQLFRRLEDPEILCLTSLALVLAQLGYPEQARQRCATAIEIARVRAPYHEVYSLNFAAILDLLIDDPQSCLRHSEAALALAHEHGFDGFLGSASLFATWAKERCTPSPGAWQRLQTELDSYRRCTQRFGLMPYQALLAEACLSDNATVEGLAIVAAAEAMMDASGERASEGNLLRVKALLLAQSGRPAEEVERCFAAAIAAAQRNGSKLSELRATNSLASWLGERGQAKRARELLLSIRDWFSEGFQLPDLQRANSLLERLRLDLSPVA